MENIFVFMQTCSNTIIGKRCQADTERAISGPSRCVVPSLDLSFHHRLYAAKATGHDFHSKNLPSLECSF